MFRQHRFQHPEIIIIMSENFQWHGLQSVENELNLGRKHLWKVLYKTAHFVPIHYQTWPPQAILVSD
jgi:hypothetical protein